MGPLMLHPSTNTNTKLYLLSLFLFFACLAHACNTHLFTNTTRLLQLPVSVRPFVCCLSILCASVHMPTHLHTCVHVCIIFSKVFMRFSNVLFLFFEHFWLFCPYFRFGFRVFVFVCLVFVLAHPSASCGHTQLLLLH